MVVLQLMRNNINIDRNDITVNGQEESNALCYAIIKKLDGLIKDKFTFKIVLSFNSVTFLLIEFVSLGI